MLVIGGTGQLGAYHVNQLIAAGERVIVLARPSSSFERLTGARGETYEVVIADLRNPDEVTSAIAEAKPAVIIDASNLPGIRMENGESFYWATMRNIVAAAEAHGVTQVIRHSPRSAREMLTEPPAAFRDDPRVINYMRDSARAEIALETAARNSPTLNSTIVLNRNLPPEPATATGNGTLSDDLNVDGGITRSDLARLANTCVLNPACYGRTFNAVDPTLPPPAR
ncbi:MAG: NAD(P)H-binding protein [Rhodospirillaceae bacterium]|nr:NAD(P)H-binding protein [Rhodospirillaceae bacterium]